MAFRAVARSLRSASVPRSLRIASHDTQKLLLRTQAIHTTKMSSQPYDLRHARVQQMTPLEDASAKWLGLRRIQYLDPTGKERSWDCAVRKTRKGDVDAVAVLTIVHRPGAEPHVLLVSQFRPPVGKVIVELPAGLIDAGEETDEGTKGAALRELSEETGYGAKGESHSVEVKLLSGIMFNDPGLTNSTMKLCTVEIQLAQDAPEPVAHPDEGEYIERHLVPLRTLYEELENFRQSDYAIDARLAHLATGMKLGQDFAAK